MTRRFRFADALWFRVPLKALVLVVAVFSFLSLYPALASSSAADHERAFFGLVVVMAFVAIATTFTVAISDSYVEVDGDTLFIRFEAFFNVEISTRDIVRVAYIDPRPRWRYCWGLSTNFKDRVACSHGGPLVEIELTRPCPTRLWPRRLAVRRYWLAVRDHAAFIDELRRVAPRAFDAPYEARAA